MLPSGRGFAQGGNPQDARRGHFPHRSALCHDGAATFLPHGGLPKRKLANAVQHPSCCSVLPGSNDRCRPGSDRLPHSISSPLGMGLTVDQFDGLARQASQAQAIFVLCSLLLWVLDIELTLNSLLHESASGAFLQCRSNPRLAGCSEAQPAVSVDADTASILLAVRSVASVVAVGLVATAAVYHANRHLQLTSPLDLRPAPVQQAEAAAPWRTVASACRPWRRRLCSRRAHWGLVGEVLVMLPHIVPGAAAAAAAVPSPTLGSAAWQVSLYSIALAPFMFLRLFVLLRWAYFSLSPLSRPAGQFITRFVDLGAAPQAFMLKSAFRDHPVTLTAGAFSLLLLGAAYVVRVLEISACLLTGGDAPRLVSQRALSLPPPLEAGDSSAPCLALSMQEAVWLMMVSSLTVGYGDVVPESYAGRAAGFLGTLLGVLLSGILIASTIAFLRLSLPEQAVGQFLQRSVGERRLKGVAASAVQAVWRHYKAEQHFLTWVQGAAGTVAFRPVSGRLPLELAAKQAVHRWRTLRFKVRSAAMNSNLALQRSIRTGSLLTRVQAVREAAASLAERVQAPSPPKHMPPVQAVRAPPEVIQATPQAHLTHIEAELTALRGTVTRLMSSVAPGPS